MKRESVRMCKLTRRNATHSVDSMPKDYEPLTYVEQQTSIMQFQTASRQFSAVSCRSCQKLLRVDNRQLLLISTGRSPVESLGTVVPPSKLLVAV